MPIDIRVVDFSDQTGALEPDAVAALKAEDPDVKIVISRVYSTSVANGLVVSQIVEAVPIEEAGGPTESRGTQITLEISLGPGTWFESVPNLDESERVRYAAFLALDADFPSGHVRVWTGYGTIEIGGETFLGFGELCRIPGEIERANITTERKTYQLSGAIIDPALISEEDIDASFGRPVIEYLGFLNPDTHELLDEPEIRFEGEISSVRRVDGPESTIELNAEDQLANLDRVDGWRYTDEHQQQFYPGDRGCEPARRLDQKEVLWGGHRVGAGQGSGGGRNRDRDHPREP